jgi:hypothetical protein
MHHVRKDRFKRCWLRLAALATLTFTLSTRADDQVGATAAAELDTKIIAAAKENSQVMANLTYLSDMIGPRVTGSPALKRANAWTAEKMKEYGLTNVRLEAWSIPEGWERGHATGRIVEPDNGRVLSLASYAWYPGTSGKVKGDVVYLRAKTVEELDLYKGKLKNAIVLSAADEAHALGRNRKARRHHLWVQEERREGDGGHRGLPKSTR